MAGVSREALAERVFARIDKLKIEPTAANLFATALILWDEDRCKGFHRAKVAEPEAPARSSRHDIDT